MQVFLSHTFHDGDRELVGQIESLFSSHDVQLVTGRRLGGEGLTPEIQKRIRGSDACVALMTRRERLGEPAEGRWSTHPWVRDELNHARGQELPSIALIETGVVREGAYGEREPIPFDRESPLPAFLALSETLRIWREQLGQTRVARVSPDDIGRRFRAAEDIRCRYRFVTPEGDRTDWVDAEVTLFAGGTLVYLKGVRSEADQVEVEVVEGDQTTLYSEATPQWLSIALQSIGG